MAKPKVFISHRWDYNDDYYKLINKFDEYDFEHLDYSVPEHDPIDANRVRAIEKALAEQIRQCNYLIIFANMAIGNSKWCEYELKIAKEYNKPVLSVKPHGYTGNIPDIIKNADTEGGPVGFNTPAIIRKICDKLNHPYPDGV